MAAIRKEVQAIVLKPVEYKSVYVPIVGLTELIVHKWSEKAKRMMLEKQMGKARPKKDPKDPQAEYEASMYRFEDGRYGFPATGFKAAIVGACRLFDDLPMTVAKLAIHVIGEGRDNLIEIVGEPHMREDIARNETGVADIRYRAGFWPWRAVLPIRYNATMLTLEAVLHLVDAAGQGGVGDWRPSAPKSATGIYGMFAVDRTHEIRHEG